MNANTPPFAGRRLTRSPAAGKIAGVCAGLADYFDVDVVFVRVAWVVLSVVPGGIVGGALAYVAAWLVMPERRDTIADVGARRRLERSSTDRKIAGVCGGIAEYLDVDPTPVRLLWIVLTIVPGAIVAGVLGYVVAWILMPPAAASTLTTAPQSGV